MKKMRVGIIGTGGISNFHLNGYKALADRVELVCACDIDRDKVDRYIATHGIGKAYYSYDEMLAAESLDAVSVCTWNSAHKGASIAALNAGVNVICEKPMAMNQAEALEMEAAALRNKKLLMIAFVRRFGNDADLLRDFINGGTIGDIYYAKASYTRRNGCPGGWFGDKSYSGGGPLIDLGVHCMDLVRYLAGNPNPISAYGVTYSNLGCNRATANLGGWVPSAQTGKFIHDVEDFASALVRFDNGLTMLVEASFNLNIKKDKGEIELFGTKAGVKIDPQVEIFTDMNGRFVDIKPGGDNSLAFNEVFNSEIRHFIDCVETGCECRSKASDGVALMKIIDAIYESARIGAEVKI